MINAGDMKSYVASLVETNRALASELRATRTSASSVGRELEGLRAQVELLERAQQDSQAAETSRDREAQISAQSLRAELREVSSERDELGTQLAEATGALDEILESLRTNLSALGAPEPVETQAAGTDWDEIFAGAENSAAPEQAAA